MNERTAWLSSLSEDPRPAVPSRRRTRVPDGGIWRNRCAVRFPTVFCELSSLPSGTALLPNRHFSLVICETGSQLNHDFS